MDDISLPHLHILTLLLFVLAYHFTLIVRAQATAFCAIHHDPVVSHCAL